MSVSLDYDLRFDQIEVRIERVHPPTHPLGAEHQHGPRQRIGDVLLNQAVIIARGSDRSRCESSELAAPVGTGLASPICPMAGRSTAMCGGCHPSH